MEQSDVSQQLTTSFDNTSPRAAATPCCKDVRARMEKLRFVPDAPQFVGEPEVTEINPDGGIMERALKFTQRVRIPGTIKIKLVCVCMDDGRTLNATEMEKKVEGFTIPLSYKIKVKMPFLAPLMLAKQLDEIRQFLERASDGDPDAMYTLERLAGEEIKKAARELRSAADNVCKNMNKCAGS